MNYSDLTYDQLHDKRHELEIYFDTIPRLGEKWIETHNNLIAVVKLIDDMNNNRIPRIYSKSKFLL